MHVRRRSAQRVHFPDRATRQPQQHLINFASRSQRNDNNSSQFIHSSGSMKHNHVCACTLLILLELVIEMRVQLGLLCRCSVCE